MLRLHPSFFARHHAPLRWLAVALLALLLAGCASRTRAPVEDRGSPPGRPAAVVPPAVTATTPTPAAPGSTEVDWRPATYTVKRGDTLYQVALDHGLDYREFAAWNNIENINLIRVGQVLRLTAPGDATAAAASTGVVTTPLKPAPVVTESRAPAGTPPPAAVVSRNSDNFKSSPKAVKEPYSEQAVREVAKGPSPDVVAVAPPTVAPRVEPKAELPRTPAVDTDDDDNKVDWVWPAKGKVVGNFSETANLKGIDIAGAAGTPVLASAGGTVVYAGTGLRGYGKLIIIKHNKTYLSAYAHNRDILVKEGQQVTRGQKIAEMGNTDTTEVKLHFEIRRLGKPMDPVRYLPPA